MNKILKILKFIYRYGSPASLYFNTLRDEKAAEDKLVIKSPGNSKLIYVVDGINIYDIYGNMTDKEIIKARITLDKYYGAYK